MKVSVLEPELIASSKMDGIVLGAVRGVRMGRTPKHDRAVEHIAPGLGRILEALQEISMLLGPPAIPLAGVIGGTLESNVMRGALVAKHVSGIIPEFAL